MAPASSPAQDRGSLIGHVTSGVSHLPYCFDSVCSGPQVGRKPQGTCLVLGVSSWPSEQLGFVVRRGQVPSHSFLAFAKAEFWCSGPQGLRLPRLRCKDALYPASPPQPHKLLPSVHLLQLHQHSLEMASPPKASSQFIELIVLGQPQDLASKLLGDSQPIQNTG